MSQYLFADQIAPETWVIRESRNKGTLEGGWATAYLVVGDNAGIMIDSGFGKENLRSFVEDLTDKPVSMCALTHGHADHAGGIRYFDTVYAERQTVQVFRTAGVPAGAARLVPITDHSVIDLGGRTLEVFVLGGHSPGSVAFLDRKERLLFTGDNIGDRDRQANADGGMLWYARDPDKQPSLFAFMQNIAKILVHRGAYDYVCWGHGSNHPLSGDIVESFMMAALQALSGAVDEQAEQETDYDGTPKFRDLECKRISQVKNARILYDKRFMNEPED